MSTKCNIIEREKQIVQTYIFGTEAPPRAQSLYRKYHFVSVEPTALVLSLYYMQILLIYITSTIQATLWIVQVPHHRTTAHYHFFKWSRSKTF